MRDDYPQPTGWRLLIRLPIAEEKSAGGVIIPQKSRDDAKHIAMLGQVVRRGPLAYTRDDHGGKAWCKEGDFVMFGKYAGTRFIVGDYELRLINDDEVQAVVPDPKAIRFSV